MVVPATDASEALEPVLAWGAPPTAGPLEPVPRWGAIPLPPVTAPRPAPRDTVPVSVVVPAHDEEVVIGRFLSTLLADARPGELDVTVVCNGCTDDTAAVARQYPVRVVEVPEASKHLALRRGDALAEHFPRFYVDADVQLTTGALRATADVLAAGAALAAAPRLDLDLRGCGRAVRAYYRVWRRLPYCTGELVGSGVYGVSAAGHRRMGPFPGIIADDLWFREHFAPGERMSVRSARFVQHPPRDLGSLLRVRTRQHLGNLEYHCQFGAPRRGDTRGWGYLRGLLAPRGGGRARLPRRERGGPAPGPAPLARRRARVGRGRQWTATGGRVRPGLVQRLRARESRVARGAAAALSVLDPRPWAHVLRLVHHENYAHVEPLRRAQVHPTARIAPNVSMAHGERVVVGARTHVNARTHLWAGPSTGRIVVGEDCLLAPNVFVTASDYGTAPEPRILDQPRREADVVIGRDCWLGTGVVVTAGVEIGDGCVVGAGAVVTRSLPPGSIAVGVPARVVAHRDGSAHLPTVHRGAAGPSEGTVPSGRLAYGSAPQSQRS